MMTSYFRIYKLWVLLLKQTFDETLKHID